MLAKFYYNSILKDFDRIKESDIRIDLNETCANAYYTFESKVNALYIAKCLSRRRPRIAICILEVINNKIIEIEKTGSLDNQELNILKRSVYAAQAKSSLSIYPYWKQSFIRKIPEDPSNLKTAEKQAISFENILRLTCLTNGEEASYRSSAFSLRARSLYLQGHFGQAHHFLDLASSGLFIERFDHRFHAAIVNLSKAELLTISADYHYNDETFNKHIKDFENSGTDDAQKNLKQR